MPRGTVQISQRVIQVARLIKSLKPEEQAQLGALVPELLRAPKAEAIGVNVKEAKRFVQEKLAKMADKYPPLSEDDEFLGGLTVKEYFSLPEEERERIWEKAHSMSIDDFEEYEP